MVNVTPRGPFVVEIEIDLVWMRRFSNFGEPTALRVVKPRVGEGRQGGAAVAPGELHLRRDADQRRPRHQAGMNRAYLELI